MPGLGWLDVAQIDFNAFLLLEPLFEEPSDGTKRKYLKTIHKPSNETEATTC